MRKINLFMLSVILLCGCASQSGRSPSLVEASTIEPSNLDGAYELVSATTNITKPERSTERLIPPEWVGMWIFQDGHFSETLMKQRRSWSPFPTNQQDLGYRSFAGTYKIEGKNLLLKGEYNLNPLGIGQPINVEYRLDGDTLTLTERFYPHMEDLSEGQTVIVLRRLK